MQTAPPPFPDTPGLTAAAADRWRQGRGWRRFESRWTAVLPLAIVVMASAADGTCRTPADCAADHWQETVAALLLTVEFMVLLARARRGVLLVAVAGALLWLLPGALPNEPTRLAALVAHGLLAAALVRAEVIRRRSRQGLDMLMGPPVAYPWTAAGASFPGGGPVRPLVRRALAGLLIAASVLLVALGAIDRHDARARAAAATQVEGTVLAIDRGNAEVAFRLPDGGPARTTRLEIRWADSPEAGDHLPLLADGRGFVEVLGDTPDITGWLSAAAVSGTTGILLAASAAGAVRRYRGFSGPAAPAMRVLVQPDSEGDLLVRPVDGGPAGPALWRLRLREASRWRAPDEGGPRWLPERPARGGREEPPTGSPRSIPPEAAAAALDRAEQSVPALLYRGPDGPHAQLVVFRPPAPDADWLAVVAHERPAAPKPRRRGRRFREEELAVPAQAAALLAEAPDGPPEPARRIGMPRLLRCTAGPLAALLLAGCVHFLAGAGGLHGLVQPLFIGIAAFVTLVGAGTWQIGMDRDGLTVASLLRVRRFRWSEVNAAAVQRGRLTVQCVDGRQVHLDTWPARVLGKRFGGPDTPLAVAGTITVLAHRPRRRPAEAMSGPPIGVPHVLINRTALACYLLFVLGHFLLR
ncbi:hypothetical protein ACFXKJ_18125 [Kitasatospora indigofera]|uniref:hypothetical protein n=1 Tax=Kitasatospora indigofera TaxID=67307 RepID=UPI0036904A8C